MDCRCLLPCIFSWIYEVVVVIFWAKFSGRLTVEDACFSITITLGIVLIRCWFMPCAFREISGAVTEWPWYSRFMRKSSKRDNTPNLRFFVLLNSWDNFFVTLPQKFELCSFLVIWQHSSFRPNCSQDVPDNFPCSTLPIPSCF